MKDKGIVGLWLEKKYIEWINEVGEVKPQVDFAIHLGLKKETFNRYYNGERKPSYKQAIQICQVLKDFTLMDILGYTRPAVSGLVIDFPPEVALVIEKSLKEAKSELLKKGRTTFEREEIISIITAAFAKFEDEDIKVN